jgi:hypothetical protein
MSKIKKQVLIYSHAFQKKYQITTYKTNGSFEQNCLVIEGFEIIKMVGFFSFKKKELVVFWFKNM